MKTTDLIYPNTGMQTKKYSDDDDDDDVNNRLIIINKNKSSNLISVRRLGVI